MMSLEALNVKECVSVLIACNYCYIEWHNNYMDRFYRTCLQCFCAEFALHHLQMLTLEWTFKVSAVLCSSHRGVRDEHSSAYGHHSQPRAPPRVCVLSVCNKWKRKVLMWRKEPCVGSAAGSHFHCCPGSNKMERRGQVWVPALRLRCLD